MDEKGFLVNKIDSTEELVKEWLVAIPARKPTNAIKSLQTKVKLLQHGN